MFPIKTIVEDYSTILNRFSIVDRIIDFFKEQGDLGREQGKILAYHCRYRIENKACAIGSLIPDTLYSPVWEDYTIVQVYKEIRHNFTPEVTVEFLTELQQLHDTSQDILQFLDRMHGFRRGLMQ